MNVLRSLCGECLWCRTHTRPETAMQTKCVCVFNETETLLSQMELLNRGQKLCAKWNFMPKTTFHDHGDGVPVHSLFGSQFARRQLRMDERINELNSSRGLFRFVCASRGNPSFARTALSIDAPQGMLRGNWHRYRGWNELSNNFQIHIQRGWRRMRM